MKNFKKFNISLALLLSTVTAFGLVACTSGDDTTPSGDGTQYTFEAEYVELTDDMVGTGTSGSPQGRGLIQASSEASNGFYVHSLSDSTPLKFEITSDSEVTTTLYARFGNNLIGTNTWTPDTFSVTVNGTSINYGSFTTSASSSSASSQNFTTYDLGDITLNEGENEIILVPLTNTAYNNLTSGPSVDYITVITTATLSMTLYNEDFLA